MAKYLVTSGSAFRPFTYDELVKPIQQMAEAHNASQDAYDQISAETEALRQYLDQEPDDSYARSLYNDYTSKLNTLQNNLWANGYTAQTRRDLSAARAGYASNITRLGKAVKDRQDRSAAYWKMKHEHPDMIMGTDPGLANLDDYLKNDRFGQDYYAYSGTAFTKQVSDDAKNRAQELLRDPKISSNPDLVGWLTRISTSGFTSQEVDKAAAAIRSSVRGNDEMLNNLDPTSKLLANILSSHLSATGAKGQVSDEEYNRLVEYGIEGLSDAVGKTDYKDYEDKAWALDQDWKQWKRKIDYQNSLNPNSGKPSSGSGSGSGKPSGSYQTVSLSYDNSTPMSQHITKQISKKFGKTFDTVPVINNDGSAGEIKDIFDAEHIMDGFGLEAIRSRFGGIDPLDPKKHSGVMLSGNNEQTPVRLVVSSAGKNKGNYIFEAIQTQDAEGKWKDSAPLTKEFNQMYNEFLNNKSKFEANNPGVNVEDYMLSGKDWDKLAKEYDIPDSVPHEYYPYILGTLADVGNVTPAYLIDSDMKGEGERWGKKLIESYGNAHPENGNLAKTNDLVIYKVESDGSLSKDPIRDYRKILGNGKKFDEEPDILSITANPEDILNNKIYFNTYDGKYAVNPRAFGNDIDAVYKDLRKPYRVSVSTERGPKTVTLDDKGIIHYLMKPLLEPAQMFTMSNIDIARWNDIADELLGPYFFNRKYTSPVGLVIDSDQRESLRNAIVAFIDDQFGSVRDKRNLERYKMESSTGGARTFDNGSVNE